MAEWIKAEEMPGGLPDAVLHQAHNPNKGGRPEGAKDKTLSGRRNRPRNTSKSEVVVMAADWHVTNGINDIEQTVVKFFPIYSQGMTEDDRYFRSRLAAEISKRSQ